jgi:hypothetical protein
MVGWYDPATLVRTGIRVAISTVFGEFADKREAIAAANAVEPQPFDDSFNYAKKHEGREFWLDYLADTGDGWNPTYAIARLVTADSLTVPKAEELPRGSLLLLGGDQVYATASKEQYHDRFLGPFDEAYAPGGVRRWPEGAGPDLYAIPGNHDWYDGLNAFFGLFCRRRVPLPGMFGVSRPGRIIAGRHTQQTRSYFALKLPGGWWLWGTDSQLEGYIDQPQIDFFQHAASYWMEPESKLILCVADPSWVYVDPKVPKKKFESFAYLERLAGMAENETGQPMRHRLKLVLTGDSHHYARYYEDDRHYIVCGGGGAFLHPTHHLRDKSFDFPHPKPGATGPGPSRRHFRIARSPQDGSDRLFPDRGTSKGLAWWNVLFAGLNPSFLLVLFSAYGIFNWLLDFNARVLGFEGLADSLRQESSGKMLYNYGALLITSPWPIIMMAVALGGYIYFADASTTLKRIVMGALHAAAQFLVVTLTICGVVRGIPVEWGNIVPVILATAASAIVSTTLFGCYLLFSLNALKRHPNEAFSSLGIEGYKSFLRIRIKPDGQLTIFPIGLKTVPNSRKGSSDDPTKKVQLLEDPIHIPPDPQLGHLHDAPVQASVRNGRPL